MLEKDQDRSFFCQHVLANMDADLMAHKDSNASESTPYGSDLLRRIALPD